MGVNNYFVSPKFKLKASRFKESFLETASDLRGFAKKPLSHVSHLSVVVVMILVFLGGSFEVSAKKEIDIIDPIGLSRIEKIDSGADDSEDFQITATLASVLREEYAEDAFNLANEKTRDISIALASTDYLAKPAIMVTAPTSENQSTVREYIVQDGDTLSGIARANGLTTDTLRWANSIDDIDSVMPGDTLVIPSAVGVLHTVKGGETISGIASRYKASVARIESYNNIIDEELVAGMQIMIPDGVGAPLPDKPAPVQVARSNSSSSYGSSSAPSYVSTSSGPNRFPWGYCTWWVASKRSVPWNGNAWSWYGNSKAYGKATGKTPVPGAIMVTWESYVGHVAYVESVNGTSFTVSEMNYVGYGRVSRRTISSPSAVSLIGFIY